MCISIFIEVKIEWKIRPRAALGTLENYWKKIKKNANVFLANSDD